jgi:hypothetical protein
MLGDCIEPHRRYVSLFKQPPTVFVIVLGLLLERRVAFHPFKKPRLEITQQRAALSENYISFLCSLGKQRRFHSPGRRQVGFLGRSTVARTVDRKMVMVDPASFVQSHRPQLAHRPPHHRLRCRDQFLARCRRAGACNSAGRGQLGLERPQQRPTVERLPPPSIQQQDALVGVVMPLPLLLAVGQRVHSSRVMDVSMPGINGIKRRQLPSAESREI